MLDYVSFDGECMSSERVSIAITCYNAEATIERAVRSAMAQNWPNLEIIALDDASQDGSLKVLERLAVNDERIRIIARRINGGVAAARNALLAAATGPFIAFFDDDDWSHPARIACQVARLTNYEAEHGIDLAACYTARLQNRPNGDQQIVAPIAQDQTKPCHGTSVANLILMGRPVAPGKSGRGACATCSLLARRDVFNRLGGFDEAFRRSEDTEFNLRLALAGGHFIGIKQPLVEQTISVLGHKTPARELKFLRLLIHKHQDAFPDTRWQAFMEGWIEVRSMVEQGHGLRATAHLLQLTITKPDIMARKLAWYVLSLLDIGGLSHPEFLIRNGVDWKAGNL